MKKLTKSQCVKIASRAVSVLLVAVVAFCLFVVVQVFSKGYASIGGYSFFRVVTPSMEPSIMVGEIIITDNVPMTQVKVNDVISFKSLSPDMYGAIITHRVVEIVDDENGEKCFLTRGDANLSVDGRYVVKSNFIGKVVWTSGDSFIAAIFSFVSGQYGFIACVLLPLILILSWVLGSSVKRIKNSMQNLVELTEQKKNETESNANVGISQKEYEEMCDKIRKELIEELRDSAENNDSKTE